jgi:PHD/YefM family antitoxin component YafN of YafNO toxin-antitoxin module
MSDEPCTTIQALQADPDAAIAKVRSSGQPLLVQRDGRTDAVLLSPDAYAAFEQERERIAYRARIAETLRQAEEGRCVPLQQAFDEIAEAMGLDLELARREVAAEIDAANEPAA